MGKKDRIEGTPCKVLFFGTNFSCYIDDAQVLDGNILIESGDKKYEFIAGRPVTFMQKSFMSKSFIPLYLCKWDEIIPVNFELDESTKRVPHEIMKSDDVLSRMKISNLIKKAKKVTKRSKNEYPELEIPEKQPTELQPDNYIYHKRNIDIVPTSIDLKFNGATKLKSGIITPEMLRSTLDMRFIKSMKEASILGVNKKKLGGMAMMLMAAGVVIAFVLYGMYSAGLLKF
jgi:hypothetical protein